MDINKNLETRHQSPPHRRFTLGGGGAKVNPPAKICLDDFTEGGCTLGKKRPSHQAYIYPLMSSNAH